ncbi:MAG: hypothetical protein KatS3mg076_1500 [Candidatus Binatia bacterium]|nr:MAG: hypothetical protein KatS3mg076_1500 [Candidatus Binatia bacterium]
MNCFHQGAPGCSYFCALDSGVLVAAADVRAFVFVDFAELFDAARAFRRAAVFVAVFFAAFFLISFFASSCATRTRTTPLGIAQGSFREFRRSSGR